MDTPSNMHIQCLQLDKSGLTHKTRKTSPRSGYRHIHHLQKFPCTCSFVCVVRTLNTRSTLLQSFECSLQYHLLLRMSYSRPLELIHLVILCSILQGAYFSCTGLNKIYYLKLFHFFSFLFF